MQNIRAKFICNNVVFDKQAFYPTMAQLTPVAFDSNGEPNEENKSFAEATPAGSLEINISADVPAAKFFQVNREYYLDFTRIPLE